MSATDKSAEPAVPSVPTLTRELAAVLAAVQANLNQEGYAPGEAVREASGLTRQLLLRRLQALEAAGQVYLEKDGPGSQLKVFPTAGLLADLGESPPPAPEPPQEERDATWQALELLDRLAALLFRQLSPLAPGLGAEEVQDSLRRALSALNLESEAVAQAVCEPAESGQPPALTPAEAVLEERLDLTRNPAYGHRVWYHRTRDFSRAWDRQRRYRLGVLSSYFEDFQPIWEHPQWAYFNQGRREADSRGADYNQWISAQFADAANRGRGDVAPLDLAGERAATAYLARLESHGSSARGKYLGPAPYTLLDFDPADPRHRTHAQAVLQRLEELARSVYGEDPSAPGRLALEAVRRGRLPARALELRPGWLGGRSSKSGEVEAAPTKLPVII
ncbi:MAG: hypothetical protein KQJ78_22165 [Deltaproteobacteria bacterium]|nr:hypothetical protein [Deltaproteobacteria bacterium]